ANSNSEENDMATNNSGDKTVQDVFDDMTEEQKNVVYFMIGTALEEAGVTEEDGEKTNTVSQSSDGTPFISHKEAFEMTRNVFEMANSGSFGGSLEHAREQKTLSHSEVSSIVDEAKKVG